MKDFIKYNVPIKNIHDLPSYPIPTLKDTLDRFLEWVKPLVSIVEFEEAKDAVQQFLSSEASGKLENKIVELGSRENNSWIFDYWVRFHLLVRDPLTPYTNVPVIYDNKQISCLTSIEKAARIISAVSKVYLEFKKRGNSDYKIGKKRYSNDQFHGMLGAINHIKENMDTYYINSKLSKNAIILYKNNIFSIDVVDSNNQISFYGNILKTLKQIVNNTTEACVPNANYVTAEPNRDVAGIYLDEILKNKNNQENYQLIKDAIFVINLDDNNQNNFNEELYGACFNPNYFNRWHGKGLEFSVSGNGVVSFIVDHSYCDGGTEIYLINEMHKEIERFSDDEGADEALQYIKLNFILSNEIQEKLKVSLQDFTKCMDKYKAEYVEFNGLTRELLREKGILSGDGFIHIAFQAAQYMTYKKIYNTYISVDARKFFRGRTECNRPITEKSLEFVKQLVDGNDCSSDKLKSLLTDALNAHHKRVKLCQSGDGVNRYLYVLNEIYKDYKDELSIQEEPELFHCDAFKIIGENRLSTTSFGHEDIKYLYFPPVMEKGFGIYYMVGAKSFIIITAFNEDYEMMQIFNENLKICIDKMLSI